MKVSAILIFHFTTIIAAAQHNDTGRRNHQAAFVVNGGYWVVESNINTPKFSVVHFYSDRNIEIHTETITGVQLNCKKNKVKLILKKVLQSALAVQRKETLESQMLSVAGMLK